jgi:hypothetical protein
MLKQNRHYFIISYVFVCIVQLISACTYTARNAMLDAKVKLPSCVIVTSKYNLYKEDVFQSLSSLPPTLSTSLDWMLAQILEQKPGSKLRTGIC